MNDLGNALGFGGGTGSSCIAEEAAEILKEVEIPQETSSLAEQVVEHTKAQEPIFSRFDFVQHPYDTGGHSAVLIKNFGIWPGVGDFRKLIEALSRPFTPKKILDSGILDRRFGPARMQGADKNQSLEGAVIGNLMFLAVMLKYLQKRDHGLVRAIENYSWVWRLRKEFSVLPISLDQATLRATLSNGQTLMGESIIADHLDKGDTSIVSLDFAPTSNLPIPVINDRVRDLIREANLIILFPGSFWTSLMPNLIVRGVPEALRETSARICMITNIMTRRTESSEWTSLDFVERVVQQIGRPLDHVFCNDGFGLGERKPTDPTLRQILEGYEQREYFPVKCVKIPHTLAHNQTSGVFAQWKGNTFVHNREVVRAVFSS